MWAAQRMGYLGELPPGRITAAAAKALHLPQAADSETLTLVNHFGFGAVCGSLYAALREGGPRPTPDILAGLSFGLGVWLASYDGLVPALGILPTVQWDRPGRPESMAAAHAVFGATLAAVLRRL